MTARNNAELARAVHHPRFDPQANAPAGGATSVPSGAEFTSGESTMTGTQAAALRRLAEEAFEPEAFNARLTRAEAARRIAALSAKLRLQDGPPHTL